MFCDKAQVKFIGGRGGDGMVSFRREKFVPKGGPDGGDGGRGGNVILETDPNINTLTEFNKYKKFKAESGTNGHRKNQTGKGGEDLVLKVPLGTMIFDQETHELIVDLSEEGQSYTMVRGGKGGLGNARFVTSIHQAPKFAEHGEKGQEIEVTMELKLVADVAIIGLPSAGKSTLIAHISNAKPKIAEYHFTTLIPNLGVVDMSRYGGGSDQTFVIADVPGLIPGAHEGKGLGHQFLRHISRTHILVHLLDGTLENIVENFDDINKELELYDKIMREDPENSHHLMPEISKEEQIVVINKVDSLIPEITEDHIKQLEKKHPELKGKIHIISAVTGEGIKELIHTIWKHRTELMAKKAQEEAEVQEQLSQETDEKHKIFRPHLEKRHKSFKIELISEKEYIPAEEEDLHGEEILPRIRRTFRLTGERIEQIVGMTDWSNYEAVERIYRYISNTGIKKSLKKHGAQLGDIITIGEHEIKFRD